MSERSMLKALAQRLEREPAGRVTLAGFAVDENSSHLRGASEAPPRIREMLHSEAGNLWTEEQVDLSRATALMDVGDFTDSITEVTALLLAHRHRPICLGGDHSISLPIVSALHRAFGPLDLVQFDAHPDLYDEFAGNRHSHACTFARILERGLVRRLVQVGVRAATGHQREQARRFDVEMIEARELPVGLSLSADGPLYVSIDVDVLDPAFAPGVAHREPGGLSTRQLLDTLHRLRGSIVGADVVEYNPARDVSGLTAAVCAKLVKELAAKMQP